MFSIFAKIWMANFSYTIKYFWNTICNLPTLLYFQYSIQYFPSSIIIIKKLFIFALFYYYILYNFVSKTKWTELRKANSNDLLIDLMTV